MSKTTKTYWNVLDIQNADAWETIEGTDGTIEQLTLAIDEGCLVLEVSYPGQTKLSSE